MRKTCLRLAPVLVLAAIGCGAAKAEAPANAAVMVVGSFHFLNSTRDAASTQQIDLMTAARQREIATVIDGLSCFHPTKLFFEVPYGTLRAEDCSGLEEDACYEQRSARILQQQYDAWRAGAFTLSAREVHQLAFRLARRAGHQRVYAADYKPKLDDIAEGAARNGQQAILERVVRDAGVLASRIDAEPTILARLRTTNSPAYRDANQRLYGALSLIGSDTDPAGADYVAGWERRNLVIASRIARQLEPGDHAIVIYGAGHAPLLRRFLQDTPHVELVEPSAYLTDPPRCAELRRGSSIKAPAGRPGG